MRRLVSQLLLAIVLFVITSVVFFIVTHLLHNPVVGVPFSIIKTVSFGPECHAGEICPLILYQRTVLNWQMLIVDIVIWWVGVIAFQYIFKLRKSIKSHIPSFSFVRRINFIELLYGIVLCLVLYFVGTRLFITNKDCGGFTGATCPFGSVCIYKPQGADYGNCVPVPEHTLYRILNNLFAGEQ